MEALTNLHDIGWTINDNPLILLSGKTVDSEIRSALNDLSSKLKDLEIELLNKHNEYMRERLTRNLDIKR